MTEIRGVENSVKPPSNDFLELCRMQHFHCDTSGR